MIRRPLPRSAAVLGAVFALTLPGSSSPARIRSTHRARVPATSSTTPTSTSRTTSSRASTSTSSCRSWARASAARRSSGFRCSSSGRTRNSGDFAPTYYLQSDAPLYYYSFTDAYIASVYRSLSKDEQARFDPMITGFNPADMYGVDHIRRVLKTFPGVFSGIGEFSIHKEFVSAKVSGETASLTNPALDRILDFAAEAGLVVIIHNDIDVPFAKQDTEPVYLTQMKAASQTPSEGFDHLGPRRARADRAPRPGVG